jgi:photosystem II stability/assembly factor-like uncharacterized protein
LEESKSTHFRNLYIVAKFFVMKKLLLTITASIALLSSFAQTNWSSIYHVNSYNGIDLAMLDDTIIHSVGSMAPNTAFGVKNIGSGWSYLNFDVYVYTGLHVYFSHPDTGFVVTFASGQVFKTTNGGVNWTETTPTGVSSYGAIFLNAQTGFIGGWSGGIVKTSDGGTTWIPQTTGIATPVWTFHFIDENIGFAGGDNGVILKTTNGGTNWTFLNTGVTSTIRSINFPAIDTGYAVGLSGTIIKTIDGGATWTPQTSGVTAQLRAVKMVTPSLGYIAGASSTFLKTEDGGQNWIFIDMGIGSFESLVDMEITSDTLIYVLGGEDIYRSDGNVTAIDDIDEFIPVDIYPNPTTDRVTINLDQKYKEVVVRVSNVIGQVVFSQNYKSTSSINLEMNATSGIYFVDVQTEKGKSKTVKVIKN